jgi:hypothetical protein
MSIYATLHTHPTCHHTHEVIYITRGASAELVYPLYDKVFRFEDIEQITFTFKQGKTIFGVPMFKTLKDANDKDVIEIDSRFYHFDNDDYGAIIFNLSNEDTKAFKAGVLVDYEIAIKLNTDNLDSFAALGGKDSIIIEPQHPIEVRDSLYSHLEEN